MSEKPSDAAKMCTCLADLICGRAPTYPRKTWLQFVVTDRGVTPSSPNRQEGANACEVLWQLREGGAGADRRVSDILGFEEWYHSEVAFMANEPMTREPVYVTLHGRTPGVFLAVALERAHPAATAVRRSARAQAGRVGLGLGVRSAKRIVDHKNGAREGCVLVGDRPPKRNLRGVVSAGQRNFIRKGKTAAGDVEFTDGLTMPITACQIHGWDYPRKYAGNLVDMWEGFVRRWPGVHPFGLWPDDLAALRALAADVTSSAAALSVARMMRVPSQRYRYDRYTGGSIYTLLMAEQSSSTDETMIEALIVDGTLYWATCCDGVRSTQEDQQTFERDDAYFCRKVGGTIAHAVPKPAGEVLAWSVDLDPLNGISFRGGVNSGYSRLLAA